MNATFQISDNAIDPEATVLRAGNTYWVRCVDSWCVAVLDGQHKWKCFATGEELSDVICVCGGETACPAKDTFSSRLQM